MRFFVGSYVLVHKVFLKQNSIERIVIGMLVLYQRSRWVCFQVLIKLVKQSLFREKGRKNKNETFQKLRIVFVLKINTKFCDVTKTQNLYVIAKLSLWAIELN